MDMVEVFLRQSAGFLSITNLGEVFLRQNQIAGFLTTTNNGPRTKTVIGRR